MTTLPFTILTTALGNYANNTGTGNINCSCEYFNNFKSPNVLQNNLGMHLLNEVTSQNEENKLKNDEKFLSISNKLYYDTEGDYYKKLMIFS